MEEQAVNNQVQQPPVNPASPKPGTRWRLAKPGAGWYLAKSNYWIIAGIILVFLLIFSTIYVRSLPSRKPISPPPTTPSSISPTTPSQPSPSASPAPNGVGETADWKTYAFIRANSSVPKFQIKYPTNWDYREVSAGNPLHLIFYTSSIGKLSRQVNDTSSADDPSLPQPLKAPVEIQVAIGKTNRCPCEDVTIGELPAQKITLESWEIIEVVNGEYTFSIMRALKDGLNVDSSLPTVKEIEIFNGMLSTFKFTPASPTGGDQKDQVVCTQEAKLCPDGSYVSRQPPSCAFAPCPQKNK
ncbi:MAG: hypothetical protein AAB600_02265 [Patescibacteria group bacterium]